MPCDFEGVEGCKVCSRLQQIKEKTRGEVLQGIEYTSTRYKVLSLSEHGFCFVDLSSLGEFSTSLNEEVESLDNGGNDRSLNLVTMGQNIEGKRTRNRLGGNIKRVLEKNSLLLFNIL